MSQLPLFSSSLVERAIDLFSELDAMDLAARVEALNELRAELHKRSPFASEPVDYVRWVPADAVHGNPWNPNTVAPPEMRLLALSIESDGYTQPIVTYIGEDADGRQVVDGFHRHRVGKEVPSVAARVHGYLPVVTINEERGNREDRMAATIRHNRARGRHRVDSMSDIVMELRRRKWTDERIGKELGMDPDEVLRLAQITGLAELFRDREFSEAWEAEHSDEEPQPIQEREYAAQ